ncbi:hypothetical protein HOLleu_25643 [Holothuria leucospilota]|uniref:Uncharacterized protein n=1 Tax=Holothuria leucospilota TaxID=206669 RepID=A0A9Q1H452_HOLLE|nr:hypothetical protein HOLleu_25643 [Holothuria leucospilota]
MIRGIYKEREMELQILFFLLAYIFSGWNLSYTEKQFVVIRFGKLGWALLIWASPKHVGPNTVVVIPMKGSRRWQYREVSVILEDSWHVCWLGKAMVLSAHASYRWWLRVGPSTLGRCWTVGRQ